MSDVELDIQYVTDKQGNRSHGLLLLCIFSTQSIIRLNIANTQNIVNKKWAKQIQELMVDFYQRLLKGEGRADALRNAQLALKARYPHPLYWGAFMCQDDPAPLTKGLT